MDKQPTRRITRRILDAVGLAGVPDDIANWLLLFGWIATQVGAMLADLGLWPSVMVIGLSTLALVGLLVLRSSIAARSKTKVVDPRAPEATGLPARTAITSASGVHGDGSGEMGLVEVTKLLGAETITDMTFRLIDILTPGQNAIVGRTLVNCHVVGPAVIAIDKSTNLDGVRLHGKKKAFVTIYADDVCLGAILLKDCTLRRCRLTGISIVGKKAEVEYYRKSMRDGPDASAAS